MADILKDDAAVEAANKTSGIQAVKPKEPVEVKWTEKSKYHKAGETSIVHRVQAEKLIKDGKATIVKK